MEKTEKKIDNIIKEVRKQKKMTQQELADRAGMRVDTIRKYEYGFVDFKKAKVENAQRIADALGCFIEELFSREDNDEE